MSDDSDKKSDATLKHLKSKDVKKEQKLGQRKDIKVSNARSGNVGSGVHANMKRSANCGCNRPCRCENKCGCVHNCYLNKYNPRHAFYYANPKANCQDSWLSDYTAAGFADSCGGGISCDGGYAHWNNSGSELSSGCHSLQDSGDHVTHQLKNGNMVPHAGAVGFSYRGTSPYVNSYEKSRARARMRHFVMDGVYF